MGCSSGDACEREPGERRRVVRRADVARELDQRERIGRRDRGRVGNADKWRARTVAAAEDAGAVEQDRTADEIGSPTREHQRNVRTESSPEDRGLPDLPQRGIGVGQ